MDVLTRWRLRAAATGQASPAALEALADAAPAIAPPTSLPAPTPAQPTTTPVSPAPPQPRGYAVLDLETTGFSPARDRVLEVAVVHVDPDGATTREWTTLVHPQRPGVGATHVHGITAADVRAAPSFADLSAELVELLAGRVLVAHNAAFDVPFLRAELERAGARVPALTHLCTLVASKHHLPGLTRRRLADCCAQVGVDLTDAHAALGDARATAGLLRWYLSAGADHTDLLAAAGRVVWPQVATARRPPLPRAPLAARSPARLREALRPGQSVAFTGGRDALRSALERRTREAGLVVAGAVSARTAALVTDDATSATAKARAALQHGTPVLDRAAYAALLQQLAPGVVDLRAADRTRARTASA